MISIVDVEQVHHPLVLGARDAVKRRDDGRLLVAAQHVAQGQAAGERVRIGIVVQQDEDAVGVAQEPLVLLHLEARKRSAELGEQRAAEELGQRQVVELGDCFFFLSLAACGNCGNRWKRRLPLGAVNCSTSRTVRLRIKSPIPPGFPGELRTEPAPGNRTHSQMLSCEDSAIRACAVFPGCVP